MIIRATLLNLPVSQTQREYCAFSGRGETQRNPTKHEKDNPKKRANRSHGARRAAKQQKAAGVPKEAPATLDLSGIPSATLPMIKSGITLVQGFSPKGTRSEADEAQEATFARKQKRRSPKPIAPLSFESLGKEIPEILTNPLAVAQSIIQKEILGRGRDNVVFARKSEKGNITVRLSRACWITKPDGSIDQQATAECLPVNFDEKSPLIPTYVYLEHRNMGQPLAQMVSSSDPNARLEFQRRLFGGNFPVYGPWKDGEANGKPCSMNVAVGIYLNYFKRLSELPPRAFTQYFRVVNSITEGEKKDGIYVQMPQETDVTPDNLFFSKLKNNAGGVETHLIPFDLRPPKRGEYGYRTYKGMFGLRALDDPNFREALEAAGLTRECGRLLKEILPKLNDAAYNQGHPLTDKSHHARECEHLFERGLDFLGLKLERDSSKLYLPWRLAHKSTS